MKPAKIFKLRRKMKMGRTAFGRALGTTAVSVWKWERSIVEPSGPSRKLLEYLETGQLKINPEDFVMKRGRKRKIR